MAIRSRRLSLLGRAARRIGVRRGPRALVTGYFSFDARTATAGDLLACEVVDGWLARAGIAHDVAMAPKYGEGVDWESVDPGGYSHVVWVCGPVTAGPRQTALRERFKDARQVAVDISLIDDVAPFNPYDAVVERDSADVARPDISMLAAGELAPVAGLCLVGHQREYGERGLHDEAAEALDRLVSARTLAVIDIDTVLKPGRPGRRSPAEVEALIARTDVVLTNRLHGLALAVKHGVPALAIDAVRGGGKVTRQARALGWPAVVAADSIDDAELERLLDWCLSEEARVAAREAGERGRRAAAALEGEFLAALDPPAP